MINIADLPFVRAQLERDAALTGGGTVVSDRSSLPVETASETLTPQIASGAIYPAKRLALENGQYRVVDNSK
jgi:hypothetical protein